MDLRLFFSPVPEEIYSDIKKQGTFYKNIKVYQEKFPDYKSADIALIGISDKGINEENAGTVGGANALRKKLYRLSKGSGAYNIVDLGNISEAIDTEQTFGRVQEVCHACIENNVLPILIGGSQDMGFAQYLAYEEMEKLISVLNVDAFLDMEDKEAPANQQHIQKMLMHQPNYLFNYSHLAYQTYLVNPQAITTLEKLYFEAHRIGALRHDIKEMEPVIRQADMMSFDLSAIKSSDFPATVQAQPFGLTGEEACQLCWYAGINEKLSAIGFYEFDVTKDDESSKSAAVLSTMIWYFIEGFYHRKESRDFRSNDYMKYVVSMPMEPEILTFYKSNFIDKWWMEVPNPSGNNRFNRNSIVPCSYSDYQQALKGELPERWIVMHSKLF
ncbi:formimidoylglutamase [Marivirga sp.]|uniref:formimidoylglutamase n=1 Tax=Marivirga sp. TaxID=2018662 RepID=UPI002D7EACE7|nr:formimidoylglutamase [Marivirga sp.]HET8858551.1 formimidoylglutamase [Marivirga sp.]